MVSTNSITSSFVPFILDGAEKRNGEPDKDFEAITTEVLQRLAPSLQYVIRGPLLGQVPIGFAFDNYQPAADELAAAEKLKALFLGGPHGDTDLDSYWFLSSTGKFILLMIVSNQLGHRDTLYRCIEIAPTSAYAGLHHLHERPLEVFFDKLYEAFSTSITQAEERLSNMKGRSAWLAEVISRYESTIDTPRS